LFEETGHSFEEQGIKVGKASIDVPVMKARKDGVVNQLTGGIKMLLKKNKVTFLPGHGSFVAKEGEFWKVKVGTEEVLAKQVIVATGSKARHLPNLPVDQKIVMDNEGALNQESVPKKLAIIGAGVIGLEMGSVWRRVGSEVTVLEAMPDFLAAADVDVAKEAPSCLPSKASTSRWASRLATSRRPRNPFPLPTPTRMARSRSWMPIA
jgi:dihydrolipoamide dehydrogenase